MELARQPGTSVAAVALANGLNANMLRRWVHECEALVPSIVHKDSAAVLPAFVQLPVPPAGAFSAPAADVAAGPERHRGGDPPRQHHGSREPASGQPQRRLAARGRGMIRVDANAAEMNTLRGSQHRTILGLRECLAT